MAVATSSAGLCEVVDNPKRICELYYRYIVLAVLSALPLSSHAQIYKCTVNGKTVFTDQPCDAAEEITLNPLNVSERVEVTESIDLETGAYSSDYWYEDAEGYYQAVRKAESEQAPMIIYFRTDWCPFCVAVENNLLPKLEARRAIKPFVKIRINPDHGGAEKKIFKSMGGTGYPTFLVKPHGAAAKSIAVTPRNSQAVGRKYVTVDQFVKAIEKYTPLESLPVPTTPEGLYARAQAFYQARKYAFAERYIKAAIERRPEEISYYHFLNVLLVNSQSWEQLVQYWSQFIALVPDNADAYVQRGSAYYYQGEYPFAQRDAEKAIELGSEEGRKLHQKIRIYLER